MGLYWVSHAQAAVAERGEKIISLYLNNINCFQYFSSLHRILKSNFLVVVSCLKHSSEMKFCRWKMGYDG